MLKKRTKLIILGFSIVVLTSTIFSTVMYKENTIKVQKQAVIQNNILLGKISAKKVIDKKAADKKALAKKIADKKIADAKALAKKIADAKAKAASDLKKGVANAIALGHKLHPNTNFKLSDGTELPINNNYYQFKLFDSSWNDIGADWYFVVSKKTGLAYRAYSDNTMLRDLPDVAPVHVPENVTLIFTVDNNVFTKLNFQNNDTFYLRKGDTITTQATVLNGSVIRTMEHDGAYFSTVRISGDSMCLKLIKDGSVDLQVVPDYSDWDHAYTIHIVVTN